MAMFNPLIIDPGWSQLRKNLMSVVNCLHALGAILSCRVCFTLIHIAISDFQDLGRHGDIYFWRFLMIFGYSAGGAIQRSVPEFPGRQVDVKIGQEGSGRSALEFEIPPSMAMKSIEILQYPTQYMHDYACICRTCTMYTVSVYRTCMHRMSIFWWIAVYRYIYIYTYH